MSDAENDEQELTGEVADASTNSDLVTVYTAYYRNDHGGVGVYIWCDRYELLDMEDYESRYLDRCAKCGSVMQNGKCPVCGSTKSKKAPEEYEELVDAIEVTDLRKPSGSTFGKTSVPPMEEEEVPDVDENGNPVMNPDGTQKITVQHKRRRSRTISRTFTRSCFGKTLQLMTNCLGTPTQRQSLISRTPLRNWEPKSMKS